MDLHRLTPTSRSPKTSHAGRCAACEAPVKRRERAVHMYGELFHHDCAFYRPLREGSPRAARARQA